MWPETITSWLMLPSPAIVACTVSSSPGYVSASMTDRIETCSPRASFATRSWPMRGDTTQPKPLRVHRDAGRGNHVDAAVRIERAVADCADRAALGRERVDLRDAAGADRDLPLHVLAGIVGGARAGADVDELAGESPLGCWRATDTATSWMSYSFVGSTA